MMEKILVVDDDRSICEIIEFNLKNEGFDVESVHSAEDALQIIENQYKLIILDIMMGGMSGYRMAEKLRNKNNNTPIIFLTAKDTENDILTGFSVGADDYISKPFSIKELIARIKAVIKRNSFKEDEIPNKHVIFKDFIIDHQLKEVIIENVKIAFTKTEFEILALLVKSPDTMFTREEIINGAWDENTHITDRTVDVHISRLRKKLGKYAPLITNRTGFGYRFDIDNFTK